METRRTGGVHVLMLTQDVLRVSISDKCNLKCLYCRPHGDGEYASKENILKYEEIVRIIQLLTPLGIKRIRITGGEPTLRRDAHLFISMLNTVQGIEDISLTSNGIALNDKLKLFKCAGLKRINISLDTLNKTTFTHITGFDGIDRVLESIDTALAVGLDPVKINVVPLKGINDSEALDFVQLAFDKKLHVRFLEYFYTNGNVIAHEKYFVSNDVFRRQIIDKYGSLVRTHAIDGNGPARNYHIDGMRGSVGFLDLEKRDFCYRCRRLRLSSEGKLYLCLFSDEHLDIRKMLRTGMTEKEIRRQIELFLPKKEKYTLPGNEIYKTGYEFTMRAIGG